MEEADDNLFNASLVDGTILFPQRSQVLQPGSFRRQTVWVGLFVERTFSWLLTGCLWQRWKSVLPQWGKP